MTTKTLWHGIVFIAVAIVSASGSAGWGTENAFHPREDLRPIPACGPAAVTSLLALLGDDVLLSTVESSFRDAGVENPRGAVAISDLLAVLKVHGRAFQAFRWPKGILPLRFLPTPCIVHLKKTLDPGTTTASSELVLCHFLIFG